jgi:hypothetical protein
MRINIRWVEQLEFAQVCFFIGEIVVQDRFFPFITIVVFLHVSSNDFSTSSTCGSLQAIANIASSASADGLPRVSNIVVYHIGRV